MTKSSASKKTDFQQRKDLVLSIVVNEYIKSVLPVGSSLIAQEYHLDLSSATIRNILAELEEEGFLMHPHTSAGRIPTQRGYRYYVDHLMDEIQLLEGEKKRILTEYQKSVNELELLLEKTSQMVSDVTHYTSIVSVDGWGSKLFLKGTGYVVDYPESRDVDNIAKILHTLEEKERILKVINGGLEKRIHIYIGHEIALKEIENCSLAVSVFKKKNGPSGRIAVLGPTRMDYERVVSALDYVTDLMREVS